MSKDETPQDQPQVPSDMETIAFDKDFADARTVAIHSKYGPNFVQPAVEKIDDESLKKLCESARFSVLPRLLMKRISEVGSKLGSPSKYAYEGVLGRGGMGQVLLVTDNDIRRRVAMKLLLPHHKENEELVERFLDEVQIAGQLQHPNILPIYDIGSVDKEPFFTMKLVEGHTLQEIILRLKAREPKAIEEYSLIRRLQIFQQVCMGLAYCHDKGVIHRDIKPANIMVGPFGEVLIVDWGLAMVMGEGVDQSPEITESMRRVTTSRYGVGSSDTSRSINGTPAYMAPEQARGLISQLDARADIYSLGAMLYELLVLEVPLRGPNTLETLLMVASELPVAPSQRAREKGMTVPVVFDEICLKALSKKAEDRYSSAAEFAAEVQRFIDGTKERERRQREVDEHLKTARSWTDKYFRGIDALVDTTKELETWRKRVPPYAPLSEKRPLWALRDRLEQLERDQARYYEAAHDAFDAALGIIPNSALAREGKADLFWEYFLKAESAGDEPGAVHFRARVEAFHDGKYAHRLERGGRLTWSWSQPPDRVEVTRVLEHEALCKESQARLLDPSIYSLDDLAPGTYVLKAWKQGFQPINRPFTLKRCRDLVLSSRFYGTDKVPKGFVLVTGGSGVIGGDVDAPSSLPRTEVTVDDFLLARYPISSQQYLEYINALVLHDRAQAHQRIPRMRADTPALWVPKEDGTYDLGQQVFEGQDWNPLWPIFGLSYSDAGAYCHWRGTLEGRAYRLPTETEWEWAARGPAAFPYPWGRRFEPNFCKMKLSRKQGRAPEAIGVFEADRSLYDVCDLAGGVHEWCAGEFDEERGMVVLRGGSWLSAAKRCRAAARLGDQPYDRHMSYGFRLALSLVD